MEFSRQEYWSGLPFPSPGGGGGLVTKSCPTLATCELGTYQAPRSMGFFRQEYWNGLPFPSPDGGGGLVTNSCPTLATPWTVACQAPLSMGFPRQEYWSQLPFPSPGDLSDPEIKPRSPALQEDSLPTELRGKPFTQNGEV